MSITRTRLRDAVPALPTLPMPEDSPWLAPAVLALATMSAATRNARVLLAEVLHGLPGEALAGLLQILNPSLTDKEIAGLCGVTVEAVGGWQHYQRLKFRLDGLATKRRRCRRPDERSPASPDADAWMSLAILGLVAMARRERKARLLLIEFLNGLPGEELALLAMTVQPHLKAEEIIDLTGVTARTPFRWDRYQRIKPKPEDYFKAGPRRRWYYLIDRLAAGFHGGNSRSGKIHATG